MTARLAHTTQELESRSNDGIDVRLLWSEYNNRVLVSVADAKTGDGFAIEVREGERAMDVFHHPFAFAAWRDMEMSAPPATAAVRLASSPRRP